MNVAEVIAKLRAQKDTATSFDETYADPQPLNEAAVARLRLPDSASVSDEQVAAWWIEQLPSPELADIHMLRLPSGDQDALLMFEPGRSELRVLGLHKFIEFWWKYDTFADYLAHWFRFEER